MIGNISILRGSTRFFANISILRGSTRFFANRTPIARITPRRIAVPQSRWGGGYGGNGGGSENAQNILYPILFSAVTIGAVIYIATELRARRRIHETIGSRSRTRIVSGGLISDLRNYWNQLPVGQRTIYTLIGMNAVVFLAWQVPNCITLV
jgi:hypothetical protein